MAQTKKKRRRKQRGTQAGNIDARRKSRPRSRAEAKSQARSGGKKKTGVRHDTPPTWKGSVIRGVIASSVFTLLLILIMGRGAMQAIPIGIFMLIFYIPAGYYMDLTLWRRRERGRIRSGGKKD